MATAGLTHKSHQSLLRSPSQPIAASSLVSDYIPSIGNRQGALIRQRV